MITNLEKYNPTVIPFGDDKGATFIFPLNNARDVILADLATEMTDSNNRFYFNGHYWSSKGPDKFFDVQANQWFARIVGAVKETVKYSGSIP